MAYSLNHAVKLVFVLLRAAFVGLENEDSLANGRETITTESSIDRHTTFIYHTPAVKRE